MAKAYVFLAEGFEEIEALAPVDLMRRGGIQVTTVSVTGTKAVKGAHGITVEADEAIDGVDLGGADALVCPGGMPGASNLAACPSLTAALKAQAEAGRWVAAICAAPAVTLAPLGVLEGRAATCYPGFEDALAQYGGRHMEGRVVIDGNVITSNGPSSALQFGLALVEALVSPIKKQEVADGLLF